MNSRPQRAMRLGITASVVAMLTAGLASCASSDAADPTSAPESGGVLRVGLYGGGWADAVTATAVKAFEEETGATVEFVLGNPSDIAAQIYAANAQGAEPPVDIIQGGDQVRAQLASAGMLVPISEYVSDPVEVFGAVMQSHDGEYSPGSCDWHLTLAYNEQKFEELQLDPPTSWADLQAPELAGHVAIPNITTDMGLPTAFAFSGSDQDLSAGIEALGALDTHSVYSATSDVLTDLGAGNVWAAALSEGGAWRLVDGTPGFVALIPEVPGMDGIGPLGGQCLNDIVTGTSNQELAEAFLKATYDAEAEVEFAKLSGYAPADPKAKEMLVAEEPSWAARIPNADEVIAIDWPKFVPDLDRYVEEFNAIVLR